jgi:hypothetical protein
MDSELLWLLWLGVFILGVIGEIFQGMHPGPNDRG